MTQDQELFELCREVYKQSAWKQEPDISYLYKYWDDYDELCVISIEEADDALVPAYTSDYLLEKLPATRLETWHNGHVVAKWFADGVPEKVRNKILVESDTPLKALLKLVIALDDAGVKL